VIDVAICAGVSLFSCACKLASFSIKKQIAEYIVCRHSLFVLYIAAKSSVSISEDEREKMRDFGSHFESQWVDKLVEFS